jgi:hypothetical protein
MERTCEIRAFGSGSNLSSHTPWCELDRAEPQTFWTFLSMNKRPLHHFVSFQNSPSGSGLKWPSNNSYRHRESDLDSRDEMNRWNSSNIVASSAGILWAGYDRWHCFGDGGLALMIHDDNEYSLRASAIGATQGQTESCAPIRFLISI